MEKKKWKEWIYWFSLALAVVFVYKMLDSFTSVLGGLKDLIGVLMPFIFAILIAYIFYIPARKLESIYRKSTINIVKKRARGLSVLCVYIIAIIIIYFAFKFVIPAITVSVKDLVGNFPGYYNSAIEYLDNVPEESILSNVDTKQAKTYLESLNISQFIKVEDISSVAAKGVMGATNFIFNLFVAIVVSIYILLERTKILQFIKKLTGAIFKNKTYKRLGSYFRKTNEIFYKFISSQVLDAVVVGTIMSIALSIMDVKYGVLLGVMIGVFNIIPYFGAIIAVTIAVTITIFTGGIWQAIMMTVVVIILQQIDANIINPRIVGTSLKLSPILIIFAVTIGGAYFGFLGMFLAVPVIAMLKLLILDYIELKDLKNKKSERKNKILE